MRPQGFMECASNDWYGLVEVDWLKGVPEPRKSVEVKVTMLVLDKECFNFKLVGCGSGVSR